MPGEITILLQRWRRGDADARQELVSYVYPYLKEVAKGYRARPSLAGRRMGSPASDIYSLVVLYELVTGASPFGSSDSLMAGLERAVRALDPRLLSSVVTEETASLRPDLEARSDPIRERRSLEDPAPSAPIGCRAA